VVFRDGGTAITCTGGNQTLNGSGVATCQISYASMGAHTITAVYGGDTTYASSTSNAITQRVVNPNVTGLAFTSVKVKNTTTQLTSANCSGLGTSNFTCAVPGTIGRNDAVIADVGFVTSTGALASYATDATNLPWTSTGMSGAGTGTVAIGPPPTTSTVTTQKDNSGTGGSLTVTLSDGLNSFTATLNFTA
jgi:hypothetical protein